MEGPPIRPDSQSPWGFPNYDHPPNRTAALVAVNICFTAIAIAAVILRMYSRSQLVKSVGLDDWMISLAALMAGVLAVCNVSGAAWGIGRHLWDTPKTWWETARKIIWGTQVLYTLVLGMVKLAILLALLRLTPYAFNRRIIYITLVVVLCLTVSLTLAMIFQCDPIEKVYHVPQTAPKEAGWWGLEMLDDDLPGKCINRLTLYYTATWLNIFTDFAILLIPIPMLLHVRLPEKQKMILIGVFSLGGLVCFASIVRFTAIQGVLTSYDPTWKMVDLSVWSCVEVCLGIVCACIPTLKPVLAHLVPGIERFDQQHHRPLEMTFVRPRPRPRSSWDVWHSVSLINMDGYEDYDQPREPLSPRFQEYRDLEPGQSSGHTDFFSSPPDQASQEERERKKLARSVTLPSRAGLSAPKSVALARKISLPQIKQWRSLPSLLRGASTDKAPDNPVPQVELESLTDQSAVVPPEVSPPASTEAKSTASGPSGSGRPTLKLPPLITRIKPQQKPSGSASNSPLSAITLPSPFRRSVYQNLANRISLRTPLSARPSNEGFELLREEDTFEEVERRSGENTREGEGITDEE